MKNNSFKAQAYFPSSELKSNSDIKYAEGKLFIRFAYLVDDQEYVKGHRVTFHEVTGFRLLDEVDLVRYRVSSGCPRNSHILEVTDGGRAVEENIHQDHEFVRREWLVITGKACIECICFSEPEYSDAE